MLIWLLVAVTVRVVAQPNLYGTSILTHYNQTLNGPEGPCRSITRDGRGLLYVACDDRGILEYDGVRWNQIPVPAEGVIHALVTGADGVVYVGAEAGFGCLLPDDEGRVRYLSLADSVDHGLHRLTGIFHPLPLHEKVYFCSTTALIEYDPQQRGLNILEPPQNPTGIFGTDSLLYFTVEEQGVVTFNGQEYDRPPGGQSLRGITLSDLVSFDGNRLLLATLSKGLLLYDQATGSLDESFAAPEIQRYLQEGEITQLIRAGDGFAAATKNSGILLLDRLGNATQVISVGEGLPDPRVSGLYAGPAGRTSGPLWIAHGKGLSKLDTGNPLTAFYGEAAFKGRINDITSFNGQLILATSTGLYYRNVAPRSAGFKPVPGFEGEEIRRLHLFRPSRWASMLLVSSVDHTWQLDRYLHAHELDVRHPDEDSLREEERPGRFLAEDPSRSNTIYTGNRQITGLEYSRRGWSVAMRTDFPSNAGGRTEVDRYGFLWASIPQKLIRFDISRLSHVKQRTYTPKEGLPDNGNPEVFLDPESGTLLLGTGDGFYRFDYFKNRFYRDTVLNPLLPPGVNLIHAYYTDPAGLSWLSFMNEHLGWGEAVVRQGEGTREVNLERPLLRLQGQPTEVFFSETGEDIWFSKAGTLYHLDKSAPVPDTIIFRAVIRSVTLDRDSVLFRGAGYRPGKDGRYSLIADQNRNEVPKIGQRFDSVAFEWAAPSFDAEDRMMFSTRMEGLDPRWSEWGPASRKVYGNLPSGPHIFRVRAMNVYGEISESATFIFRIRKPWYGSLPAVLIYILLIAGGISLLFRNRTR